MRGKPVSAITSLIVLICAIHWPPAKQHPLQNRPESINQTDTPPCTITDFDDNGTIIIVASPAQIEPKQTPMAQFNDRRRDMFFEDYNIKQIQVIDTSVISNNSLNGDFGNKVKSVSTDELPDSVPTAIKTVKTSQIPNATLLNSIELHQPQRSNVLLPKLENGGRPSCLQRPDDTFCETVDNYPKTAVKQEITFSVSQFLDIFGPKEIDGRTIMDVDQDESVCGKNSRIIYPQMAKNQANQWIYVVNEVEYTQAVVAEICERPGESCAYMDNLPIGMYSKCKQKYSYKRLLALHPTEKRTYSDSFRFPSCCSCHVKIMDDFRGRSKFRNIDSKVDLVQSAPPRDSTTSTTILNSSIDFAINSSISQPTTIITPYHN